MIKTVFDKVSSIFSETFWFSYFTPWVFALLVNVLIYDLVYDHDYVLEFFETAKKSVTEASSVWPMLVASSGFLFFIAVLSYVFAGLQPVFLKVIEYNYGLSFLGLGRRSQNEKRRRLVLKIHELEELNRSDLGLYLANFSQSWNEVVAESPKNGTADDALIQKAHQSIKKVWDQTVAASCVSVLTKEAWPSVRNAMMQGADFKQCVEFYEALQDAHEFAKDFVRTEINRLWLKKDRFFARDTIKSSTYANIGAAVEGYGESRYGLNSKFLLLRLRNIKGETINNLVKAQARFDFCVLVVVLTILTMAGWLVGPAFINKPLETAWVPIMLLLPLVAIGFHFLGQNSYLALADQKRATIDLYRFEVLKEFRIANPDTLVDERQLWKKLEAAVLVGQSNDLDFDLDV